jgi:putative aldouronate transport system permease protein
LTLPGFLCLLLFAYVPLLGNVVAFQDYAPYRGVRQSPWVGLANFEVIFNGDPAFVSALVNTLLITGMLLVFAFPAPIILALILNGFVSDRWKRIYQNILTLPHFLSWVLVVAIFQQMLGNSGLVNSWLRLHDFETIQIIGVPELFKIMMNSQVIWKDAGWGSILFLAALSRIDTALYEATSLDGASRWRQLWHVTLPGIRPVIFIMLILTLGDVLSVGFEQILLQQGPVGLGPSEVLDTYTYNNGVLANQWGVAAAVGLVKGVVGVVLVVLANKAAHLFGERGLYER